MSQRTPKTRSRGGIQPPSPRFMRAALRLAKRGQGTTSPNPMVGAVLVRAGSIIGRGWHHHAGGPHAEIEALQDARACGRDPQGADLYVTLEPCSTHGRTPPCTDAIIAAGIRRVVVGATDPNPAHAGRAFALLRAAGIRVVPDVLAGPCGLLNASFNHWIVHRTPLVTVKAAMTLDGKIATATGESRWITGEPAREYGMRLRRDADAILVGVNTVLADNPSLTFRPLRPPGAVSRLRRIILDSTARTPLDARVVADDQAALTTIVVGPAAPAGRVRALRGRVRVVEAPAAAGDLAGPASSPHRVDLAWLMGQLGAEGVLGLLVEGGGEVNASFLFGGFAHRVVFFYAPKILGGGHALRGVAGAGAASADGTLKLSGVRWGRVGDDRVLTAAVTAPATRQGGVTALR